MTIYTCWRRFVCYKSNIKRLNTDIDMIGSGDQALTETCDYLKDWHKSPRMPAGTL